MITLNLISPKEKKEVGLRQLYVIIKNLIILFLLFTIVVAMILLVAKAILQNSFNDLVADYTLTTRYGKISNREIEKFNNQLSIVSEIQKEYVSWTDFIAKLVSTVPPNVNIDKIQLTNTTNEVVINGFAQTRDSLLQLQDNLETSSIVSEVEIPLENLLNRENINFTVTATFNLETDQ